MAKPKVKKEKKEISTPAIIVKKERPAAQDEDRETSREQMQADVRAGRKKPDVVIVGGIDGDFNDNTSKRPASKSEREFDNIPTN